MLRGELRILTKHPQKRREVSAWTVNVQSNIENSKACTIAILHVHCVLVASVSLY